MKSILDRNTEHLTPKNIARLGLVSSNDIEFRESRTGKSIPVVSRNGRIRPLHSLIAPEREADSTYDGVSRHGVPGFVIAIGLGAGFHLRRFIENEDVRLLMILAPDPAVCRAILAKIDLSDLLGTEKVVLHVAPNASEIATAIEGSYHPLLFGDLRVVKNRALAAAFTETFGRMEAMVRESVDSAAVDAATQTRLGSRWIRNAIQNLPLAEDANDFVDRFDSAIVTAAGPSLESRIESITHRREGRALIATDTSLPALHASGISPDYVVSIDAQIHSYHHFLAVAAPGPVYVFGLSVPRCITAHARKKILIAGFHPFSRIVAEEFGLSRFDSTRGNVTSAAIEVAKMAGAKQVEVIGADFGYPSGKPYARGTYLYSLFATRSVRSLPLEAEITDIAFRDPKLRRELRNGEIVYVPRIMDRYRVMTDELLRLDSGVRGVKRVRPFPTWTSFLARYLDQLKALPATRNPISTYIASLQVDQRAVLSTVLPAAMRHFGASQDAVSAIESSKRRIIEIGIHAQSYES